MPEAFIVTISDSTGRFEMDMEIPARLPVSVFKGKLLEILKALDIHFFGKWEDYALYHDGHALSGNDTLAGTGAFDGSRLTVERSWS